MQRTANPFTPVRFRPQPPLNNMKRLLELLNEIYDDKDLKIDTFSKEKYKNDWSTSFDSEPEAIVFPRTKEQVVETIKICNELKHPFISSGGRTGLSGGAAALDKELIVSFEKMNNIIDFDSNSSSIICESGVITSDIQSFAKENNLFYPVNFSSSGSSQIGGNVATNAGGIRVIKYGMTAKYVNDMEFICGSGKEINMGEYLIKNATGPNIKSFLIGSEGIFGSFTKLNIQLIKEPKQTHTALICFNSIENFDSIRENILNEDIEAFEFFNKKSLEKIKDSNNSINIDFLKENYFLLIDFFNYDSCELILNKLYKEKKILNIYVESDLTKKESLWLYRMIISESISRSFPIKYDVAVPSKNVQKLIINLEEEFNDHKGFDLVLFGHVGDGNLHINLIKNQYFDSSIEFNFDNFIFEQVVGLNGTISAEHGIGFNKVEYFKKFYPEKFKLLKNLKTVFDKNLISNPGKLVN